MEHFQKALGAVLNENGAIVVGMASGTESTVPDSHRIPVFNNIGSVTDEKQLLNYAKAAYDHILKDEGGDKSQFRAVMAYGAIVMGFVASKLKTNSTTDFGLGEGKTIPVPLKRADFSKIMWDAEVKFVDEAATLDGDVVPMPPDHQILMYQMALLLIAAKHSWFTQRHHLGASSKSGKKTGFFPKVLNTLGALNEKFKVDWRNTDTLTPFYQAVHCPSTLAVIRHMFKGRKGFADIRNIYVIPQGVSFLELKYDTDVIIRQGVLMAGFAALGDTVAALKKMRTLPFLAVMPGLSLVPELNRIYQEVIEHPFMHGISAGYLTDHKDGCVERFDKDQFNPIIAACGAYVNVGGTKGSLSHAAIFGEVPNEMEGSSQQWISILEQYAIFRTKSVGEIGDFFASIGMTGGATDAASAGQGTIDALKAMDVNIDQATWDRTVATVYTNASTPAANATATAAPATAAAPQGSWLRRLAGF